MNTSTFDWELRCDGTVAEFGTVRTPGRDAAVAAAREASQWDDLTSGAETWQLVVRARGHNAGAGGWVQYEPAVLTC